MSDSLQAHGLYSPWNYPDQNTGEGGLSLLQGIFPTGIEPRSPTMQVDSLPAEPQGKPQLMDQGSLQRSHQGNFFDGPVAKPPNARGLGSTSGISKLDPMCHN